MSTIDSPFLISFFRSAAALLEQERQVLCSLDGAIGDGDHGTSMANGFAAISRRLNSARAESLPPAELMREAAAAFIGEVGATVGPLYASAFLEAAALLEAGPLDRRRIGDLMAAFARGIARRGNAAIGDKTMLDAWLPASRAAGEAADAGGIYPDIVAAAVKAGMRGANGTKSMIAVRGRAARLQERNLGHLDPGAVSAAVIVRAFADCAGESA